MTAEQTVIAEGRVWVVDLPYELPPLRSNQRKHWADKAKWVRQIRADAKFMAHFQHLPKGLQQVTVEMHWQPSTVRGRDNLNIEATAKAAIDGLVDYGLVPDDNTKHVYGSCHIDDVILNVKGRVYLLIKEAETSATPKETQ